MNFLHAHKKHDYFPVSIFKWVYLLDSPYFEIDYYNTLEILEKNEPPWQLRIKLFLYKWILSIWTCPELGTWKLYLNQIITRGKYRIVLQQNILSESMVVVRVIIISHKHNDWLFAQQN